MGLAFAAFAGWYGHWRNGPLSAPDFKDRFLLDNLAPFRRQTDDLSMSRSLVDIFHKLIQSILTPLCLALDLCDFTTI